MLWSGGLPTVMNLPEVDPMNYTPRVTTPIIMLNGRDDFTFPVENLRRRPSGCWVRRQQTKGAGAFTMAGTCSRSRG